MASPADELFPELFQSFLFYSLCFILVVMILIAFVLLPFVAYKIFELVYLELVPPKNKLPKPACTCQCHHGGIGGGNYTVVRSRSGSKGGYEKYRGVYVDSAGVMVLGPVELGPPVSHAV
jgi:hypothetical protein